ncbi:MAG: helix-turn-helix transcriptional regulator [Lachnospiraceae bacterium]|nr:helix-turn-helix transcriptional regulator [Lachnospiraceae bacterium]
MTTAERIATMRTNSDYTQADLARLLGVTRSAVNSWELGNSLPSSTTLVQLADLFHVSTDFILGRDIDTTFDLKGLDDVDITMLQKLATYMRKKNKEQ